MLKKNGGKQVKIIKRELLKLGNRLKVKLKGKQEKEVGRKRMVNEVNGFDVSLRLKNSCKMRT